MFPLSLIEARTRKPKTPSRRIISTNPINRPPPAETFAANASETMDDIPPHPHTADTLPEHYSAANTSNLARAPVLTPKGPGGISPIYRVPPELRDGPSRIIRDVTPTPLRDRPFQSERPEAGSFQPNKPTIPTLFDPEDDREEEEGGSWMPWIIVGVGGVALIGVLVFLNRTPAPTPPTPIA